MEKIRDREIWAILNSIIINKKIIIHTNIVKISEKLLMVLVIFLSIIDTNNEANSEPKSKLEQASYI